VHPHVAPRHGWNDHRHHFGSRHYRPYAYAWRSPYPVYYGPGYYYDYAPYPAYGYAVPYAVPRPGIHVVVPDLYIPLR
jgi:hypothetical protein